MNYVCLVRVCAVFVCFAGKIDAAVFDDGFETNLNTFVQTTMDCRHVPGLTLAVVKDSETWTKGYGIADNSTQRSVTKDTLFNIGSVTKSFTMVLLGLLLSERNMTVTTKVRDILGSEYEFTDEYRTNEMTLKDLLSHRTGLAGLDIGFLAGYSDELTRKHLVKQTKYLPEMTPFRDSYGYNNYMYMYLGYVCEVLGGDTWENLLKTRLLNPLGMTSTKLMKTPADVLTDEMAKPYIYTDDRYQDGTRDIYNLHPIEPAGAILSSGEDMTKWMQFLLNKGRLNDGTQLVDEGLIGAAFKATITVPFSDTSAEYMTQPTWPIEMTPIGYGYAFFTSTYRGYKRIWHSGGLFSYITRMFLYPDRNTGIFVSTNGPATMGLASWTTKTVEYFTSDGALGIEPWLNVTTSCTFPKPWVPNSNTPPPNNYTETVITNPTDYTGLYTHVFLPRLHISQNTLDNTTLRFQMNRISGVLHSTDESDAFQMETVLPFEFLEIDQNNNTITTRVMFVREEGMVTHIKVQYEVEVVYRRPTGSDTSGSERYMSSLLVLCFIFVVQSTLVISTSDISIYRISRS